MWDKIKSYWVWILGIFAIGLTIFFQKKKIDKLELRDANNENTNNNNVLAARIEDSNAALAEAKKKLEEEKKQPTTDTELLERLKKL